MLRFALSVFLLLNATRALTQNIPAGDPLAVSLALKSVAALTGGVSVSDVTLNATVISILGSDNETGTGTFQAKGTEESRVDLNLGGGTRTDVRSTANGMPVAAWSKNDSVTPTAYPQHNNWTDAVWFFPPLSSLTQTTNLSFSFSYIGLEQHGGMTVQHIHVFQTTPTAGKDLFTAKRLSSMDFYLDPVSYLPLAISFNTHADNDLTIDIPVEIRFAKYQVVNGIQVPFHVQKMLNGGVVLDITVTSAALNSGLSDSSFTLQ